MRTLTDLGISTESTAIEWIHGTMYVGVAVGIMMAIIGVHMIVDKHDSILVSDISAGLRLIVAGILLTSITGYLSTGSETFFGTDQTETELSILKH